MLTNPSAFALQSVRSIVNAEAETLRKAKAVTSQVAQANRNKKKQDVTALVKVVVRLADKREGRRVHTSHESIEIIWRSFNPFCGATETPVFAK